MQCTNCGKEIRKGVQFCSACGTQITNAPEPEPEYEAYGNTDKVTTSKQKKNKPEKRAKQNHKNVKWVLISVLAVVIIGVGGTIAWMLYDASLPLSNGMSKKEGEEILSAGIEYMDNGEFEAAMECFAQLPSDSRYYKKAQSLLSQSKDSYRSEMLNRINSYAESGDYDYAFNLIAQAQVILPDDAELQATYENVYSMWRTSVLDLANTYVLEDQYEVALEYLNGVKSKYPDDTVLQDSYNDMLTAYKNNVRNNAIKDGKAYVDNADYPNAIKTLNAALDKLGQDEELSALLTIYKNNYRTELIAHADNMLRAQGYQAAISIINQGLVVLPGDDMLLNKISEYQTYAPIFLSYEDAYAINSYLRTNITSTDYITDNYGKTYTANRVICNKDSGLFKDIGSIQYFLESKYSTLTGTIYVPDISKNVNTNSILVDLPYVQILGDGVVLYELSSLTGKDKPVEFSVNISNVEFITVCIYGGWFRGDGTGLIPMNCVADLAVSK